MAGHGKLRAALAGRVWPWPAMVGFGRQVPALPSGWPPGPVRADYLWGVLYGPDSAFHVAGSCTTYGN